MYKLFIAILLTLIGSTTGSPVRFSKAEGKLTITHFNITFAPDLSNRVNPKLYKRPLNDLELLQIISGKLHPDILNYRRSQNQHDRLLVDFINKGLISQYGVHTDKLLIDLGDPGKFPNQLARINYIMMDKPPKRTLAQDIAGMNREFDRVYNKAIKDNVGADIWTYLDQGIDDKNVFADEKPVQDADNDIVYVNHFRNVLILPTDGYIEAGIFGKGFDLGQQTINRFRNAFLASGGTDLQKFFRKNPSYHIKPVHNERLKHLEILILEMYDRSLTAAGSATVHPTDVEIMKLFWSDWLQQSGVKHFELHPCANSKDEAQKTVINFLGVNK
ncbi:hypothetical protein [Mucilaginibacter celer]|uniref:Uncharacterized protein n=1 Tax=Mucilaginibacter celer TaxID=2305508 RepID=A0A494VTH2_9SPHI|nr:hypothetical protein [Mucilaginibacter celer]AYL94242.1 hypothetical protein HYN43_002560 [Mucilaginibacter celer]